MAATSPHLSHLLFADDVLLFSKAKNLKSDSSRIFLISSVKRLASRLISLNQEIFILQVFLIKKSPTLLPYLASEALHRLINIWVSRFLKGARRKVISILLLRKFRLGLLLGRINFLIGLAD